MVLIGLSQSSLELTKGLLKLTGETWGWHGNFLRDYTLIWPQLSSLLREESFEAGKIQVRIKNELAEMEEAIAETNMFVQRIQSLSDSKTPKAFASAIGLNFHSFYMGAEQIFEAIAKKVDGNNES